MNYVAYIIRIVSQKAYGVLFMLRVKESENKLLYSFRLDDYVPKDHILRIIDQYIEFDFIRDRVKHLYSHTGQPAVDPVVLIKMLFIGYLFNIQSERQLEKDIQVNLAYRWFIKYDIDEKIPDHSTISQTRRRKFSESTIFQDILDEIVIKCKEKGFIQGETILTDSTHIKANASMDSLIKVVISLDEYIDKLETNSSTLIQKKDDTKDKGERKRYSNFSHRSKSDPDSRLMNRKGKPKGLHYLEHRSIDISGYITDVYITPGNKLDYEPYIDRLQRQREAFNFRIHNAVADRGYGTGKIYKELTEMNINGFIPSRYIERKRDGMFSREDYIYDRKNDTFICPAGNALYRGSKKPRKDESYEYYGKRLFCNTNCSYRKQCTLTKDNLVKTMKRNIYQDYIDFQLSKKNDPMWKKLLRKRRTLLEGSFADAKNNHNLGRAKFRGIKKVQEQSFMTAITQNIKKMVKDIKRKEQAFENALALYINIIFNNTISIFC